jgi:hypothetical protein
MKIIKGTSPIPIPRTAKVPGDIKRLSRETQQSIKALRDRQFTVSGATNISKLDPWKVSLSKVEDVWKAKVALGHVQGINPASAADPVVVKHTPKIGGVAIDAEEAPLLTVSAGQTVFIKISASNKDIISAVDIVALTTDPATNSTHYQPEPTAVSGIYYLPLCDIEAVPDSDPVVLRTKNRIQHASPIIWRPNLWHGENIGGGAGEVFKERSNSGDKYIFRTIKDVAVDGKPVLKPGVSDVIPIRGIKELATSAQIKVTAADADNDILIRGNSYGAALTGLIAQLAVTDGLVTGASLATTGYTGNIKIVWTFNPVSGSATVNVLSLTFNNGRLITVGMDAVDGSTNVTGVSNIEFFMTATDTAS